MEELLNNIERAVRLNCKNEACFWTLHICDNATPSTTELKQPQSKNMVNGNIDESIEMLKECISIAASVGKKYIVVAIKSSQNDPSRTILPFLNPVRRKPRTGGISGISGVGNNGIFGLYLNQLQENTRLQIEIQEMRNRARIRAIRRKFEENSAPPTIADRLMGMIENPVIQSAIGKMLGINAIGSSEEGENEQDLNQSEQADVLKYSVETLNEAVGNEIDVFRFMKLMADFAKQNPDYVKSIYHSMNKSKS